MLAAKLIISHAGAGSVMEALRNVCYSRNQPCLPFFTALQTQDAFCFSQRKKLIVVVNDKLMHNHQAELADAMSEAGAACTPLFAL